MTQEDSSFSEEKGSKKTFISLGLWRAAAPDSTPNVQKSFLITYLAPLTAHMIHSLK